MAQQILIALITILALSGGAFAWSVIKRFDETRQLPKRPEQLRKAAKAMSLWIETGKRQGLIDGSGEVISDDLAVLEEWSKRAPFTDVVHGETLAPGEREKLEKWFWVVFAYLILLAL